MCSLLSLFTGSQLCILSQCTTKRTQKCKVVVLAHRDASPVLPLDVWLRLRFSSGGEAYGMYRLKQIQMCLFGSAEKEVSTQKKTKAWEGSCMEKQWDICHFKYPSPPHHLIPLTCPAWQIIRPIVGDPATAGGCLWAFCSRKTCTELHAFCHITDTTLFNTQQDGYNFSPGRFTCCPWSFWQRTCIIWEMWEGELYTWWGGNI